MLDIGIQIVYNRLGFKFWRELGRNGDETVYTSLVGIDFRIYCCGMRKQLADLCAF